MFWLRLIAFLFVCINIQNSSISLRKFITIVLQKVFLHTAPNNNINRYANFLFLFNFYSNAERCNICSNSICVFVRPFVCHMLANEGRIMRSSLWGSNNNPPSVKRRLRLIYAYNESTVREAKKVQLSRIGSRPRAFQRAIDEVCTLPLSLPKGGSKSKVVISVNKKQFKSNKLCYKVSLCENFQRQSCSRTIPLSNDLYYVRGKCKPWPQSDPPLQQTQFRRISASAVRASEKD